MRTFHTVQSQVLRVMTLAVLGWGLQSCGGQTPKPVQMSQEEKNALLCDPETGMCEMPGAEGESTVAEATTPTDSKVLKMVYFTDPICSSCWGIEPQLRKLKLEYGHAIEIEYHMGGLLPDWSYNSGGISKPSDVAHHWDEVSVYYDMPIDGDVWLEDPLDSSFPPSIAFKAAQRQDGGKAITFLRILREMVFLEKKNITRWEHVADAATQAGLDTAQLKVDYEGPARADFESDLALARSRGVRGFPSVFIEHGSGRTEFIYGTKPYSTYTSAIQRLAPQTEAQPYATTLEALLHKYPTLTAREYAELSGTPRDEAEAILNRAAENGELKVVMTKNGGVYGI